MQSDHLQSTSETSSIVSQRIKRFNRNISIKFQQPCQSSCDSACKRNQGQLQHSNLSRYQHDKWHKKHLFVQQKQLTLYYFFFVLVPGYITFSFIVLMQHSFPTHLFDNVPRKQSIRTTNYQRKTPTSNDWTDGSNSEQTNDTGRRKNKQKSVSPASKPRVVILAPSGRDPVEIFISKSFGQSRVEMNEKQQITEYESINTLEKIDDARHSDEEFGNIHSPKTTNCVPMAKWQTMSFPTCNTIHEINSFSSSSMLQDPQFHPRPRQNHNGQSKRFAIREQYSSQLLGNGWFRHAWRVKDEIHGLNMAMKTLRLERDFLPEYFELHRRDAVAMERLSASPYVMDIYGFCGQSALNELAHLEKGISNIYRVGTGLAGNHSPQAMRSRLKIGAMIALGLSHVHSIPPDDGPSESYHWQDPKSQHAATLVHNDINPRNIIMTSSGKPKLNDFNVAEFLTWDSETKQPCGFDGRLHEPWWRSPEEMISYPNSSRTECRANPTGLKLDEKVDVYSLGNALFVLLEGFEPRGKKDKERRSKSVSNEVAKGEIPPFSEHIATSTDKLTVAMRQTILACWEAVPERRPTAAAIAKQMYQALEDTAHIMS
mmetsp:Transcript_18065/g.37022  ORF Transcript_18065/g.37022 Transcript_18065/m.37022 type:complete len:600 (-) Transcript_18065:503-2302(-)